MIDQHLSVRRIYIYRGICDMRRSFDRLSWMIKEHMRADPLSGDVFLFFNRSLNRVKALYWDKNGFVLWYKRLEEGYFMVPGGDSIEIDNKTLEQLIAGQ